MVRSQLSISKIQRIDKNILFNVFTAVILCEKEGKNDLLYSISETE